MRTIVINRSRRHPGKFNVVLIASEKDQTALGGRRRLLIDGVDKERALDRGMGAAKWHQCALVVKTEIPEPVESQIGAD